jgi:hypothetical protein
VFCASRGWWWRALVPPRRRVLPGGWGWEGVAREKWKHRTVPALLAPAVVVGVGSGGTLLGPEGTTFLGLSSGTVNGPHPPVWGVWALVRVVVENCTVDASIFCFCSVFVS